MPRATLLSNAALRRLTLRSIRARSADAFAARELRAPTNRARWTRFRRRAAAVARARRRRTARRCATRWRRAAFFARATARARAAARLGALDFASLLHAPARPMSTREGDAQR